MRAVLPAVSVCIANYNGMDVIDACLQSVLSQDCDFPVEIIVHDDASSDGSVDHIRAVYPQVRLLESANNVGFCVSNNRMVAMAQGKYILLLNNDAELYPDALRALHEAALEIKQPAILSLPQYDAASGVLVDRGCLLDIFFNPVPNLSPERYDVAMVIGACLWIPRALWDEVGGFPEWFGSIAEDLYLCCCARLAGYSVQTLQISGYRHWQGRSFGGNRIDNDRLVSTFSRRALSERNKSFVMALTCPAPWFYFLFPLHLLLLTLEGLLMTALKRDGRFWQIIYHPCLITIWHKQKIMLELRNKIQSSRRISGWRFFEGFKWTPYKLIMTLRHGLPEVR